jgi:hypothetical protein
VGKSGVHQQSENAKKLINVWKLTHFGYGTGTWPAKPRFGVAKACSANGRLAKCSATVTLLDDLADVMVTA